MVNVRDFQAYAVVYCQGLSATRPLQSNNPQLIEIHLLQFL